MQMPKARNPRLKLRRKRTPDDAQEASEQKSKHGKPETPPTAEPNEKGAKEEITNGPGITGPPNRILLLNASIRGDAEIQRKLEAGDYDPPWEHKSPAQATFTIELSVANRQADAITRSHAPETQQELQICARFAKSTTNASRQDKQSAQKE